MRISRIFAGTLLGLLFAIPSAGAVESRFTVLLDTDDNSNTGCTVMTPAGAMDGVEAMLTTVVETGGADDGTVENVFRRECVDPATDTFGAEIAVGGGWPVGAGAGTAGFNVIETWMPPPSDTTPEDDIRLGLTAENELGDEFALLTTTPGDSQPIVLQGSAPPPPPPAATPIPTAGAAGLALLALVLLIAGLIALRRRAALFAVMLLAGAGYSGAGAYVFMFDWQGHSPLATSGATDPAAGVDVRAFFGQWDGSQLAFRLDAALVSGNAPAITSADTHDCEVGAACSFTFTADGLPEPDITLDGALPAGLDFDAENSTLSGTPEPGSGAAWTLTVTAANGIDPNAVQGFTLTVNEAPTITSADAAGCEVGQPCAFTFTADGFPAPAFDLPGLPAGLNLDPSSGELSGTPDAGTGGTHDLTLTADNGVDPADTQAFMLTIGEAPEITSPDSFTCQVGDPCDFTFTADGDPAPTIDVTDPLPDGVTFDAGSASLQGTPAAGSGAEYALTVTAANGIDPDAVQNFTLTVNEAPAITSADNVSCEVSQPCGFTFTADGFPAPTFDLPGLPAGLNLDPSSGELSGTPDPGTGGAHDLTLTADNGIAPADTQAFTLTIGEAPEITSPDSFTCQVGDPCEFTFTADGDPAPAIDAAGALPDGVTFNAGTDSLEGTPTAGSGAEYALTVTAANGINPDAVQNFTLTVNEPPAITSADNLTCQVGQSCDFTFTADGFPAPEFDLPGLPAGLSLDAAGGVLSGTPGAGTGGIYNLTLTAGNGIAPDDTQAFTLTINEAPEITSADNLTCQVGDSCDFTFTADGVPDPEFDLPGLPGGLTLDTASGVLSGTPDAGTGGLHDLTLTASNGIAPDDTQAFALTIDEAPAITSAGDLTCQTGQPCDFVFTADGHPAPEFDLPGLPASLSLDPVSGILSGTPDAGTGGVYNLTLTAANGIAPDDTQAFTLTIGEAPEITSADSFACSTAGPCEFTFTATGEPAPTIDVTGTLPGGVTFNAGTASLEGTPDPGSGDEYVLTVSAANGFPPDADQTFTLTVSEPPVALDDPDGGIPGDSAPGGVPYHGFFDDTLAVGAADGVLANDDLGFPQASIVDLAPPTTAGGTVALTADGAFTYDPPAGFTGIDDFSYCLDNAFDPPVCATVEVAVGARPAAGDDTFAETLIGNTHIDTSISSGYTLLDLAQGDNVSVTLAGTTGGDALVDLADGTFIFDPAPGFNGAATLDFDVSNGFGAVTGTVTLNVDGIIWYFDNSAAPGGDGRLSAPFDDLSGAAASGPGHVLFLHSGSGDYTGGIALQDGQILAGHPAADSLETFVGVTAPADTLLPLTGPHPVISGTGIELALDNELHDFMVGNTSDPGISGTSFGALTVNGVSIAGTGPALDLALGSVSGSGFDSVSSDSSDTHNILLVSIDGNLDMGGGTLTGATAVSLEVEGGTASVSYAGDILPAAGVRPVLVGNHSGSVTLTGDISGSGLNGILLNNNPGGTITFQGMIDISTGANTAFHATGGGTVTATGSGSVLQTAGATALHVVNTDIGAAGLTFESVNSNGGNAAGLILDNTGASGGLTVTGNGGSCTAATPTCTGGRIQSTTGANGATAGNGVFLNNTHSVSLTRMRIDNHPNHAIFGDTVTGFALTDSLIDGANGDDAGADEGSVRFVNLLGSGAITRTDISGGLEDNLRLVNSTGTLDRLVITDTIFRDNSASLGNDGILIEANGTAVVNVTVDNSDFSAHRGDHFDAAATDDAALDLVFTNNDMSGGHSSPLGQSFILSNAQSSDVTFDVSDNIINGSIVTAFIFFQSASSTAASSIVGTFSGNTIGSTGVAGSGSSQGNGVTFNATGDGTMTALADGNTIRQWSNAHGMLVQAGDGSPVLDVTATNNLITEPDTASFPINGLHLNAGTTAAGTAQVCLDARNNDILNSAGTAFDDDFRLRQRNNSTVRLPGYAGAAGDTAAVVTFVQGNNIGTPTGSALVSGSGGGFTGGAACDTP